MNSETASLFISRANARVLLKAASVPSSVFSACLALLVCHSVAGLFGRPKIRVGEDAPMYVRRISKPSRVQARSPTIFVFEPHYALARSYVQEVILNNISVPTIDGFQCPTVEQDAEQSALLKSILFTPWSCTDPMTCGSVVNFKHLLSNNDHLDVTASDSSQPAAASTSSRGAQERTYTFQRAWKLRQNEIHVLAHRADCRCQAARKKLVWRTPLCSRRSRSPSQGSRLATR